MSASLLDSLTSMVTPDLLGQAASALGENQGGVSRGMGAVLPMLLGGVASRANDTNFASSLFKMVSDPGNDLGALGNVASLLSPGASNSPAMALGGQLLNSLFGSNLGPVGNALASYAGVRPQSASSMMSMAAPMLLAVLGKAVKSGGLNMSSLVGLLTGQKSAIAAALPSGLNVDRYLAAPAGVSHAVHQAPEPAKSSIWRWLLPLLLVLGALLLLSRCMKKEEAVVESVPTPAPQVEVAPAPAPAPVEAAPVDLPKAELFFEVGQAAMPANTGAALAPIVAYLAANPMAMAAVAGFHDPTGDAAANEELAKNRAIGVRDALMMSGVAEDRIVMDKPVVTTGDGSLEAARRVEVTIR
jgi:outer membrane protein OmpA-like peptidoglycan-associated protein